MKESLRCYFCNEEDNKGIILLNKYICSNCEKSLIETPNYELRYEINRRKVQKLWKSQPQGIV